MGNSSSKHKDGELSKGQGSSRTSLDDDENALEPEQLSYWQMIKQGYQELVNAIIRPPRCTYEISQLGPKSFDYCGKIFERRDFELRNLRGMKVVCSMWEPAPQCRHNNVLPCVIYMHGNSSARVEALTQLSLVLSLGATLVSFDFCGSGRSDGNYVSLGAFEKDDLKCVIEHLRESGKTSTIALWGRSMGAATALLHGERDPSIAGMVLDSAFADLTMLAEEMVEKGRQHGLFAPGFVVKLAIRMIRNSVLKTAEFDIRMLSPIEHADKCFIPALFVAAEGDEFVPPHHSQRIYRKYAGDKNIIIVEGDHNSNRPKILYDTATVFLVHILQIPSVWMQNNSSSRKVGLPWSNGSGLNRKKGLPSKTKNHTHRQSTKKDYPESEEQIGMTNERQADLRGKLYTMLGDRGSAAASTAAAASSSSRTKEPSSARRECSSDREGTSSSEDLRVGAVPYMRTNSTDSTGTSENSGASGGQVQSPYQSPGQQQGQGLGLRGIDGNEWDADVALGHANGMGTGVGVGVGVTDRGLVVDRDRLNSPSGAHSSDKLPL